MRADSVLLSSKIPISPIQGRRRRCFRACLLSTARYDSHGRRITLFSTRPRHSVGKRNAIIITRARRRRRLLYNRRVVGRFISPYFHVRPKLLYSTLSHQHVIRDERTGRDLNGRARSNGRFNLICTCGPRPNRFAANGPIDPP